MSICSPKHNNNNTSTHNLPPQSPHPLSISYHVLFFSSLLVVDSIPTKNNVCIYVYMKNFIGPHFFLKKSQCSITHKLPPLLPPTHQNLPPPTRPLPSQKPMTTFLHPSRRIVCIPRSRQSGAGRKRSNTSNSRSGNHKGRRQR